jgi:arylsulfatase A-like enzyme
MPADSRPNILLIMTDQQRGDCLSIADHPVLMTPNMDAIAGAGARFTRAYVTCPSCIAARRSILSGQFPPTHGMVGYHDNLEWEAPPTLPGVLRSTGYQTALVGRGMHQFPVRKRYGYEEMVISDHKDPSSDYDRWLRHYGVEEPGGWFGAGVMHNDWTARPWPLDERFHHTNWVVEEALRFLQRRDPSCPFFLTVSFIAPHPPLQPPACYFERYLRTGVPEPVVGDWAAPPAHAHGDDVSAGHVNLSGEALRSARAGYYGLINHVDDQLRRLLNPVIGLPRLARDTVVVFTSDHGEMLGDHYLWRKQVPYEPSVNIPLLISTPPRFGLAPRTMVDAPVCLEDVMPTLLDFAGVETPDTVEGRSLLPLLRGETPPWRDYLHLEHAPLHQTLTDGVEKFVWHVADGREQYFRLDDDPTECRDLIADPAHQERIAEWRQALIKELKDRPEGFSNGNQLIPGRPYKAVLPR